jgi:hypothetical protein
MPTRVAVTIVDLAANATTADPTPTTADTTNDHVVAATYPLEEIVLRIKQTDATNRIATIKAGANPPALEAGQGDLTKSIAQNEVWWVGPLTSGRFAQADGTLNIDLAASFAGEITAFHIPRTA